QIFPHGAGASLPEPAHDPAPLPFERDALPNDAAERLLERHGRPRVLLFMSTRSPVRPDLEAPLWQSLRRSAEALGCAVATVESHALDATERTTLAARLREAIAAFRPSVIVCQELLLTGATQAPEIAAAVLAELAAARRTGCKVVSSYWDSWYDGIPTLFADMLDQLDAIHVIFPGVIRRLSPAVADKVFCYPFPWRDPRPPDVLREARDAPQRLRGNFAGNRSWANQSRVAWCAEIVRAGLPVDLQVAAPKNPRSDSAYAEALASYAVTVNLTARSNGDRVFTLRTVEAPWFGSVLLEEDSDDTRYFLRPYEHYVPFATFDELAGRLDVLLTDEARRARLRRDGAAWVQRHFGALPFWSRLWRQLHGDAPAAQPPESRPPSAPPARVSVPPLTVRIPSSAETYAALARPLVPMEAR
ncbi:MAG: glycosyltransferase family 1 protein, partial [Alphaproteobacteria bacterium]|nr:glycosyltransferase family 1 protein [Alphaproteobacteria bacterium]